ncbi:MAG: PIG-L family deacetylase [Arthrobacter sp.]|jgi:LmbE family N-acetylglucosaminyl deacetylase|nr:PIG-L family deacetylase [Arthrobacter sp.]
MNEQNQAAVREHHGRPSPREASLAADVPDGVDTVVALGAHPDDIDFGAAGTLARWAEAGVSIHYVVMTKGDAGGFDPEDRDGMEARRREEQEGAARAVGALSVRVWEEADGHLTPSDRLQRDVVRVLRELRPQLVLAPHPERDYERYQRSHPDHLACGEIVARAVYPALENPFAYPELQEQGLLAYRLRHLWFYGAPAARENRLVDVSAQLPTKLLALRSHLSQHPDVGAMEAFVTRQLRAQGERGGLGLDVAAEAFHATEVNTAETIAGF